MLLPKNIKFLEMNDVGDLITNIDQPKLRENFAYELKGFNNMIPGVFADRDRGTKNIYANSAYPTVPEAAVLVGGPQKRFYDRTTDTEYDIVVAYNAASGFARLFINDSVLAPYNVGTSNNWIEATRVASALVSGTPGLTTLTATIGTIKDSLGNAYGPSTNELQWWLCLNINRSKLMLVASSAPTTVTSDAAYLGSDGLGWVNADQLVFFKHSWMLGSMYSSLANPITTAMQNLALGATPHNRWLGVETQQKMNLMLGSSATPPVMQFPMSLIRRTAAKNYFYTSAGSALLILQPNWYAERAFNLGMSVQGASTPSAAFSSHTGATETINVADHAGNFLKFIVSYGDYGGYVGGVNYDANSIAMSLAITLLYDGYQESDPIYRLYLISTNVQLYSVYAFLSSLTVNPARMSKKVSGIRIYASQFNQAKLNITAGVVGPGGITWPPGDGYYVRCHDIYFDATPNNYDGSGISYANNISPNGTWSKVATSEFSYTFGYGATPSDGYIYGAVVTGSAARGEHTLASNLQHASLTTYTARQPRFAAKAVNVDQSLIAIDQDDRTLLVNTIDGAGAVEDDNFSPQSTDNHIDPATGQVLTPRSLQLKLLGDGALLGLFVQDDAIYAVRQTLVEIFDMQSGVYRTVKVDAYMKDGIVSTDYGLVIAGKSSIQLLQTRAGQLQILNQNWVNLYDGRLRTNDNSLQQITDAYRQGILVGYSKYSRELMVQIQRNDPYSNTATYWTFIGMFPKTAQEAFRWRERVFNLTGTKVYFYSSTKDNTFLLGTSSYILKYPNLDSSLDLSWEDEVQVSEVTNSKPITCDMGINIGSLTGIDAQAVVYNLMMYLKARSVSTGVNDVWTIDLYANEDTKSFQTMTVRVNGEFHPLTVKARGVIKRLRIRIQLTSTNTNTKEFTISKAALGFLVEERPGTR